MAVLLCTVGEDPDSIPQKGFIDLEYNLYILHGDIEDASLIEDRYTFRDPGVFFEDILKSSSFGWERIGNGAALPACEEGYSILAITL